MMHLNIGLRCVHSSSELSPIAHLQYIERASMLQFRPEFRANFMTKMQLVPVMIAIETH